MLIRMAENNYIYKPNILQLFHEARVRREIHGGREKSSPPFSAFPKILAYKLNQQPKETPKEISEKKIEINSEPSTETIIQYLRMRSKMGSNVSFVQQESHFCLLR